MAKATTVGGALGSGVWDRATTAGRELLYNTFLLYMMVVMGASLTLLFKGPTSHNVACCGGSATPQDRFRLTRTNTGDHTGKLSYNYKMCITTAYIMVHPLIRTIKPQNVKYRSTNPGHNHIKYKLMQWHDRWCPHASQWPKPAYHHSPLTKSARSEHEPIPKPELTIS